jgi:hypothetical protein
MIFGLQILAILFSFFMIYFAVIAFKKHELSGLEIFSWIILWTGTIVIVVFPSLLRTFSTTFLLTRVFDLMVVGGFVIVISISASAYIKTKKAEKKLEELVRKIALQNAKRK